MSSSTLTDPVILCNGCNLAFAPLRTHFAPLKDTISKHRTHYYPSPSESETILQMLAREKDDVERFDLHIAQFKDVVRKLQCQRAEHQRFIDCLNSVRQPVRRLPAEILAEVFYHFVRDTWKAKHQFVNTQPLVLGMVCKRWRDVALSHKGLWSYIGINLNAYQKTDYHARGFSPREDPQDAEYKLKARESRLALIVEKYLDCSYPLSISLSLYGHCDDESYRTLFQLLVAHAKRWKAADLHIPPEMFAPRTILGSIEGRLPLLEKLNLGVFDRYRDIRCFSDCPKLHTFITDTDPLPALPLHQITRLLAEIQPGDYDEVQNVGDALTLVRSCPRLNHLTIKSRSNYDYPDSDDESLFESDDMTGHSIRTLDISVTRGLRSEEDTERPEISRLCDELTLPMLQTFSLTCNTAAFDDSDDDAFSPLPHRNREIGLCWWPRRAFMSLLQRSSCHLETLIIQDYAIRDIDLIDILHVVPTLTTLKIREPGAAYSIVTRRVLRELTRSRGRRTLAPRLAHMDFTVGFYDERDLYDMFESRWSSRSMNSPQSFEIAALEFFQLQTTDGLTRVRALRDGGLKATTEDLTPS